MTHWHKHFQYAKDDTGSEGRFITSVDVFFGAKDSSVPVTMEIRETVNGYPGPKLLPFGRVIKPAADINVDSTGATATTFTFPSLLDKSGSCLK